MRCTYEEVGEEEKPAGEFWTRRKLTALVAALGVAVVVLIVALAFEIGNRDLADDRSKFIYDYLPGCVFVGHLSPDTDTICTSFAAAELFNGSYVSPGSLNRETLWVFGDIGLDLPRMMVDMEDLKTAQYCLVDHNQETQCPMDAFGVPRENLRGIMDHHAVQSKFVSHETPISIDVRPWGCTSTILYVQYKTLDIQPTWHAARCMLAAILSDTFHLSSATTTDFDRRAVRDLSVIADVANTTAYYYQMGAAMSNTTGMSYEDVVNNDIKYFELQFSDGTPCPTKWSTFETFMPENVLDYPDEYLATIQQMKADSGMTLFFFSVTNTFRVSQSEQTDITHLFLASDDERKVAEEVYGVVAGPDDIYVDISPRSSRKLEFIPPVDEWVGDHLITDLPSHAVQARGARALRRPKVAEDL